MFDTLSLIEIFEKNNVALHSITEKLDTQSAMGKFFFNMTASLAQMERDLIGERTKDALAYKKAKGERVGRIPFGFNNAKGGKTLIENIKEQKIVREIQTLREEGHSFCKIAKTLNEKGYKTKQGGQWTHVQVNRVLKRAA